MWYERIGIRTKELSPQERVEELKRQEKAFEIANREIAPLFKDKGEAVKSALENPAGLEAKILARINDPAIKELYGTPAQAKVAGELLNILAALEKTDFVNTPEYKTIVEALIRFDTGIAWKYLSADPLGSRVVVRTPEVPESAGKLSQQIFVEEDWVIKPEQFKDVLENFAENYDTDKLEFLIIGYNMDYTRMIAKGLEEHFGAIPRKNIMNSINSGAPYNGRKIAEDIIKDFRDETKPGDGKTLVIISDTGSGDEVIDMVDWYLAGRKDNVLKISLGGIFGKQVNARQLFDQGFNGKIPFISGPDADYAGYIASLLKKYNMAVPKNPAQQSAPTLAQQQFIPKDWNIDYLLEHGVKGFAEKIDLSNVKILAVSLDFEIPDGIKPEQVIKVSDLAGARDAINQLKASGELDKGTKLVVLTDMMIERGEMPDNIVERGGWTTYSFFRESGVDVLKLVNELLPEHKADILKILSSSGDEFEGKNMYNQGFHGSIEAGRKNYYLDYIAYLMDKYNLKGAAQKTVSAIERQTFIEKDWGVDPLDARIKDLSKNTDFSKAKFIIVNDQKDFSMVIANRMKGYGAEGLAATNISEAEEAIKNFKLNSGPDDVLFILTDYLLGRENNATITGDDVMALADNLLPEHKGKVVKILYSAGAGKEYKAEAMFNRGYNGMINPGIKYTFVDSYHTYIDIANGVDRKYVSVNTDFMMDYCGYLLNKYYPHE